MTTPDAPTGHLYIPPPQTEVPYVADVGTPGTFRVHEVATPPTVTEPQPPGNATPAKPEGPGKASA